MTKNSLSKNHFFLNSFSAKKYISGGVILIVLLISLLIYHFYFSNPVLAIVGDYKITKKDVHYRDQIQHIFYPQDPNSYGLIQLIQIYTYAQIMKNNGAEITEGIVRNEETRINQSTRSPETLEKIKALFGKDLEAYKKVFILPTYAERIIYSDFFTKNLALQSKSLGRVQEFLAEFHNQKNSLAEFAKQKGLASRPFKISTTEGFQWISDKKQNSQKQKTNKQFSEANDKKNFIDKTQAPPPEVQQALQQQSEESLKSIQFWIKNILPRLKTGQTLNEPVDFGESWLVVKYLRSPSENQFLMEGIIFPKDNYNDWIAEETTKIKIVKK